MNSNEMNSKDMKTVVETYIIEETQELIYDNEQLIKWNELVGELGLEGQKKIVSPDKSPIPFMHMKSSLVNVFETLCPVKVDAEEYNVTPIPVEILSLMSLSKREGYFKKLEVWYDDKAPDPAVIGYTGYWGEMPWYTDSVAKLKDKQFESKQDLIDAGANHPSFYTHERYLLGRWGGVKMSFDELKKKASERFIGEKKNILLGEIKERQRGLDDLESEAFNRFN